MADDIPGAKKNGKKPVKHLEKTVESAPLLSDLDLKRTGREDTEPRGKEPPPVSQGAIDKVTDLIFNASRDKIREVTIVDRMQGKLLPQLDTVNSIFHYIVEVATFRMDADLYQKIYEQPCPVQPDILDDFSYRTAQWQKSINGVNLKSGVDVVLAEIESQQDKDPYGFSNPDVKD